MFFFILSFPSSISFKMREHFTWSSTVEGSVRGRPGAVPVGAPRHHLTAHKRVKPDGAAARRRG